MHQTLPPSSARSAHGCRNNRRLSRSAGCSDCTGSTWESGLCYQDIRRISFPRQCKYLHPRRWASRWTSRWTSRWPPHHDPSLRKHSIAAEPTDSNNPTTGSRMTHPGKHDLRSLDIRPQQPASWFASDVVRLFARPLQAPYPCRGMTSTWLNRQIIRLGPEHRPVKTGHLPPTSSMLCASATLPCHHESAHDNKRVQREAHIHSVFPQKRHHRLRPPPSLRGSWQTHPTRERSSPPSL